MLTLHAPQAETLWDEVLPIEARELPEDLARLDELLRDPRLLRPTADHWQREAEARGRSAADHGQPTIAMETSDDVDLIPAEHLDETDPLKRRIYEPDRRRAAALPPPSPSDNADTAEKEPHTMPKPIYTAEATIRGGREHGHGRTTDGELDVQLRPPNEAGGTNPEQLFAVGYAACFESALGAVARRERAELGDVSIDSRVSLLPAANRTFALGVELQVTLPQVEDAEEARRFVAAAHQVCPYSNATRGNIDVTITANGQPIG